MPRARKGSETVPAKPFADWLNERVTYFEDRPALSGDRGPALMVVDEIGWTGESGVRRLYRYRNMRSETRRGSTRKNRRGPTVVLTAAEYPRDVVEEALHHAGVAFEDIYPEIAAAEDTYLEPEVFCAHCQDIVTPIDGVCPWDGWRLSKPTGQRLLGRVLGKAA